MFIRQLTRAALGSSTKEKDEAKYSVDNYCFTMQNTLQEEKLKAETEDYCSIMQNTLQKEEKNSRLMTCQVTVNVL